MVAELGPAQPQLVFSVFEPSWLTTGSKFSIIISAIICLLKLFSSVNIFAHFSKCEIPILRKKRHGLSPGSRKKREKCPAFDKIWKNCERESVEVDIVFVKYKMETESVKSGGC